MGHSRGGGMAVLGARQFQKAGGSLSGVACWAPVSDVFARFPWGPALKDWEASDRLEVLNGRTGQTLVHPYAFYLDAKARESELNIESAATALTCPVLVVHGTDDAAVGLQEGEAIASWATQGTLAAEGVPTVVVSIRGQLQPRGPPTYRRRGRRQRRGCT